MRKNIRLVGFGLLILVILLLIVLLISQTNKTPADIEGYSTWLKIVAIIGISCISCITAQFVLSERHIETPFTPDDENYVNEIYYVTAENNNELKKYLQHRYSFFWHRNRTTGSRPTMAALAGGQPHRTDLRRQPCIGA